MLGDLRWWIGSRTSDDDLHTINRAREISAAEAERLHERFGFVTKLASQDTFAALIDVAARCHRALGRADAEMAESDKPTPRTRNAVGDELRSLNHLASRLDRELTDEVVDGGFDQLSIERYNAVRGRMRAFPAILSVTGLGGGGRRDHELMKLNGTLYFEGALSISAFDLVTQVVGSLSWVVRAHLLVLQPKFDELAAEIDELADEVETGQPSLIGLRIDDESGDLGEPTFVDVPVFEVAALREELERSGPPDERDPGLLAKRTRLLLEFGDVDAGSALVGARSSDGINEFPAATFKLDPRALPHEPVDYWAPVSWSFEGRHPPFERFAGSVLGADATDDEIELACEGGTGLLDHSRGGTLSGGMSIAELVRMLLLHAGLPEDLFPIDGPAEARPEEIFEVEVPIRGIDVAGELELASVSLVSKAHGREALTKLPRPVATPIAAKLLDEFDAADCYAVARVTASLPGEAEDVGLEAIQTALAWLITRQRYGTALLPDGTAQSFRRSDAVRAPEAASVALVRGIDTGRWWLRWPRSAPAALTQMVAAASPLLRPRLRDDLEINEKQALLALRRAATDVDPLSRIQALWQSIEGYAVRARRNETLFAPATRKAIRKSFPDGLSDEQQEALAEAVGELNNPSLRKRLRWQAERDGVAVTEGEFALLDELRDVRNDVVHGRGASVIPTSGKIDHAVGIVARLLVHGLTATDNFTET